MDFSPRFKNASARRRGFLFSAALASAVSLGAFPARPKGYVNDFAGVLSPPTVSRLESLAAALERDTGDELAVVTVPSLEGMSVEEYASDLFKAWGVGKKGKDNGVMVLVCPSERKMRIEVGYGLEAILPDGLAGQIIREDFIPSFKRGDYPGGIEAGTATVENILRRGEPAPPSARAAARPGKSWLSIVLFFSLFVGIGFFMFGMGLGSRIIFPCVWGGFFGGIPLMMSTLIKEVPPVGRWALALWAVLAVWKGWRQGRVKPLIFRRPGQGTGRGWVWGAGGGSGGGSSGSSGGFSDGGGFGGGSSGGGGASGSW